MNNLHSSFDTWLPVDECVMYTIPGMGKTQVRKDITFKTIDSTHLQLDIYYPADFMARAPIPAVILVHGDGPAERLKKSKEHGQSVSWGQLIAASGLIAVVANHRSTDALHNVVGVANDIDDLISYVREHSQELQIDAEMLCLWTCSSGGPFALRAAIHEAPPYIKGIVCYYAFPDLKALYEGIYGEFSFTEQAAIPQFDEEDFAEFSATDLLLHRVADLAPIFIARAGLDFSQLNAALDTFIAEAIAQNCDITIMNHPTAQHGFDINNSDPHTEEIIRTTLEFLCTHLLQ